ncbi:MAG: hypothetical protein RMI01_07450 [Thermodesulfovibrio sp.]|nr:hypothetical protein [Thermodesulfovibrio sp.]
MKKLFWITLLYILSVCFVFVSFANAEQIPIPKPVIDCKATLEAWGNPPNCYCPCDTCRPVCKEPEKPKPDKDKKSSSILIAMETENKKQDSSSGKKKEENKVKKCKIIVYGLGTSCNNAFDNAKNKCKNDHNGKVTFEGLCTENKNASESERYRKDIYCEVDCKI